MKGVLIPCEACGECNGGQGAGGEIEVSIVAPIGHDQTCGVLSVRCVGCFGDVGLGCGEIVDNAFPATGSGAGDDVAVAAVGGCESGEFGVGFVSPIEEDGVFGEFAEQFGVVSDDVAPEHHAFAVTAAGIGEKFEVIDVESSCSDLFGEGFVPALAQVVGFVGADVGKFAGE